MEECFTESALRHGGDIYRNRVQLDFSVNINPLGMPGSAAAAFCGSVRKLSAYPDYEQEALRRLLAARCEFPEECIACGNGASELLQAALLALHPHSVLLPVPSFSGYRHALRGLSLLREGGIRIREFPLAESRGFALDASILETPPAELTILCAPNNPVGNIIDLNLLRALLDRCRRECAHLLLDICFLSLCADGEVLSRRILELARAYPELILVNALTKSHALPGLRVGWALCADSSIIRALRLMQPEWSLSVPGMETARAALTGDQEYLRRSRELIRKERAYLVRGLTRLGFHCFPGEANFILFHAERELQEALLQRGVLIRRCEDYVGLDAHYYRIAVRRRSENRELLRILAEL